MKNKIFLLVIFVQIAWLAGSQSLPVVERVEKVDLKGFNARFSPSGKALLLTDNHFKGLRLYDLQTEKISLNLKNAKGHGALLTEEEIIFEQFDKDGFYSLDLESKRTEAVAGHGLNKPAVFMARRQVDVTIDAQESADLRQIVIIHSSEGETKIAPLGAQDYLNVSISDDRSKVLFRVSGYGSFISDLEGNILAELGNVEFPQWLDEETVVYTIIKDDGYQYLSSDLYVAKWRTGQSSKLVLPKSLIPIYPDVDGGSQKLVFNTPKGDVYLVTMKD
ncbi:MAG: hypothetical protein ABJN36_05675 [Cyclobacteriaceae bacterium]